MKRSELINVLDDLLRLDDVLAVMIAKQGLEGIVPEGNKLTDVDLWRAIRDTTNEIFVLIDKFYDYGLDRFYFELGDYTVMVIPISRAFSLLVVINSLANLGLVDVEIENTKREIKALSEQS